MLVNAVKHHPGPPTHKKTPEHGQRQKLENNKDDHMVSMEATQAEFALQQTIYFLDCWPDFQKG